MYLLNKDYLEFRCQDTTGYISNFISNSPQKLYIISPTVKLSKTVDLKYYSRWYLKCFDIIINEQKVGYLYTEPIRNTYYSNKEIVSIRIDNETLYSSEYNVIVDQILSELQFNIKGITRLDIAYDTDIDLLKRFKKFYNNIEKYTYKNRGKTTVNGTGQYDTQITIGSLRGQGKTIMVYDKSSLLRQQSKEYLMEMYQQVFGHKNIYRIEVRLTSRSLNKYEIDLMKLGDKEYLEGIFSYFMESLIDFRKTGSNKNVSRQDKVQFLTLNGGMELPKRIVSPNKIKGDNNMKYLIWKIHCDRDKEEFAMIAREMKVVERKYVELSELNEWVRNKVIKRDHEVK